MLEDYDSNECWVYEPDLTVAYPCTAPKYKYLHFGLIHISEWSTRARTHMRLANTYASGEDVVRRFV